MRKCRRRQRIHCPIVLFSCRRRRRLSNSKLTGRGERLLHVGEGGYAARPTVRPRVSPVFSENKRVSPSRRRPKSSYRSRAVVVPVPTASNNVVTSGRDPISAFLQIYAVLTNVARSTPLLASYPSAAQVDMVIFDVPFHRDVHRTKIDSLTVVFSICNSDK